MRNKNIDFRFHTDSFNLLKAKDSEGNDVMRIGGIAVTSDLDSQNEILVIEGCNIDRLNGGLVNWQHQSLKNPASIIGTISKAEKRKQGIYIECDLFSDHSMSKDVYRLTEMLNKSNSKQKMAFSIEGRALERDPMDERRVIKSELVACAVTPTPINRATFAQIIKGETDGLEEPIYQEPEPDVNKASANGGETEFILDYTDESGNRITVNKEFQIKIDKALSAGSESGRAITKESLDPNLKDLTPKQKKVQKSFLFKDENDTFTTYLEKSQVFDYFFKAIPDLSIENASRLYNTIVAFNNTQDLQMTNESLEKAFETLNFLSNKSDEIISKAESPKPSNQTGSQDGGEMSVLDSMKSMIEKGCSKEEIMKAMKEKETGMSDDEMDDMYEKNFGKKKDIKKSEDMAEEIKKSEETIDEQIAKSEAALAELKAKKEEELKKSETPKETNVEDLIKGFETKFQDQFNKFDEIVKGFTAQKDELEKSLAAKDEEVKAKEAELAKSQSDYEALANQAKQPKSVTATDFVQKGEMPGAINKGNEMSVTQHKNQIIAKADEFVDWNKVDAGDSLEKGYAEDITKFQYDGNISQAIFNRFKERGINLVQ